MRLNSRWERFTYCADTHGDLIDPEARAAFMAHLAAWKPKHRILGGDAFDFRPLRKRATYEEQREHIGPDVEAGLGFIRATLPTHYMLGNHEARLWRMAEEGAGAVGELAQMGVEHIISVTKSIKCVVYPYTNRAGVATIGKLSFLHGFFVGVNAAARHAAVYGPCLFGHVHQIAEAPVPGLERRVARSVGCLCRLDMPYAEQRPSALCWQHGWAFGVIDKVTGDYEVWQARKVAGTWIVPSDVVEL